MDTVTHHRSRAARGSNDVGHGPSGPEYARCAAKRRDCRQQPERRRALFAAGIRNRRSYVYELTWKLDGILTSGCRTLLPAPPRNQRNT
jgi:hypothetical protein